MGSVRSVRLKQTSEPQPNQLTIFSQDSHCTKSKVISNRTKPTEFQRFGWFDGLAGNLLSPNAKREMMEWEGFVGPKAHHSSFDDDQLM